MTDRQPGAPGQYILTVDASVAQNILIGLPVTVTLKRDDQPVVEGTPYNKASVLPDDLAELICPDVINPTPADAFRGLQKSGEEHKNAIEGLENITAKGTTTTLLWRNASPTSSFPEQTVDINGSSYYIFLIRYKLNASYSKYAMDICLKGDHGWLSAAMGSAGTDGSDTALVWRELAINTNNIVFYEAMKSGKSLDENPAQGNDWVVPYEIFGIKGVEN